MNQKTASFAKTVSHSADAAKQETNTQSSFNVEARRREQPEPANQNKQGGQVKPQPKAEMHLTMGGSIGRQANAQKHFTELNKAQKEEKAVKARQQDLRAKMKADSQRQSASAQKTKTRQVENSR